VTSAAAGHGLNSFKEGSFTLSIHAPIKLNAIQWDRDCPISQGQRIQGTAGQ